MRDPAQSHSSTVSPLPSVDRVMSCPDANPLVEVHGRSAVVAAVRQTLAEARSAGRPIREAQVVLQEVVVRLGDAARPSLRQVFNLSGTVLHTNLGRALLPPEAVTALTAAARGPVNLEYDLDRGERGERDEHLENMLCELTGAEAATVVNNNAAALLLVLNTLAMGRQVPTSRGELVEIGGSFRLPVRPHSHCCVRLPHTAIRPSQPR